jgi:predicted metal-binding protein
MDDTKILDCYIRGMHRQSCSACSTCDVRRKCVHVMSYIDSQAVKVEARSFTHTGELLQEAAVRLSRNEIM